MTLTPAHRLLICIATFLSCMYASAQKYEMGKVSLEELQEKHHKADTAAPAAILFKKGKTYFKYSPYGWLVVTEVEMRVKIYKKEGYRYASHELYYSQGNAQSNIFKDAWTYNLVGDSIVTTKAGTDSEFIQQKGRFSEMKRIEMPNVKEGSIIEFKYTTVTSTVSYLQDWYFSFYIPANYVEYNVAMPAYFTYNSIVSSDLPINRSPQQIARRDDFTENRITYSVADVPALKDEPYVDNVDNYRAHVKHELAASNSFANEKTQYSTSWKSFVKIIYEDESFGKQLEINSYFRKDINALLKPGMSVDEKAEAIFKFVQARMTWNKVGGFFCDEGVKKAYEIKTGNIAEINLMLIAMLKYAGVPAEPVITSTITNGIPSYPGFSGFNYVIVAAQLSSRQVLMDATGKYTVPGLLQLMAVNHVGRLILPNGTAIETDLTPKKQSIMAYTILASIDTAGKLTGKIRSSYTGYNAYALREGGILKKQDSYISGLEKYMRNSQISDYTLKNQDDPSNPIIEEFSFINEDIANMASGKIILDPMIIGETENPFTADTRMYPVNFIFPNQLKYSITLNLPDGYVVESIPAPLVLAVGNNVIAFKYNFEAKDRQLQMVVSFDINEAFISNENYQLLKDFYRRMIDKQKEKIVLKKA